MNEQELLQEGIGRKLVFLGRAANMVSVSLASTERCPYDYNIHISAYSEILFEGSVLTSTHEIDESESEYPTQYDKKVKNLLQSGDDFIVQSISYDRKGSLDVKFNRTLEIRSLPEPSAADKDDAHDELWRIFLGWKAEPYLLATKKAVFLEERHCTQEELDKMRVLLANRPISLNQGTVL